MTPAAFTRQFCPVVLLQHAGLAVAGLGLLLGGCAEETRAAAAGPMPVTVLEMQPQNVPARIEVMAQAEEGARRRKRARG